MHKHMLKSHTLEILVPIQLCRCFSCTISSWRNEPNLLKFSLPGSLLRQKSVNASDAIPTAHHPARNMHILAIWLLHELQHLVVPSDLQIFLQSSQTWSTPNLYFMLSHNRTTASPGWRGIYDSPQSSQLGSAASGESQSLVDPFECTSPSHCCWEPELWVAYP